MTPTDPALFDPIADGATFFERRRSGREAVVTLGRLRPEPGEAGDAGDGGDDGPIRVHVLDVALHGCRFHSPRSVRVGGVYRIDIHVGPLRLNSRLRVVRATPRGDGVDVGAEFV